MINNIIINTKVYTIEPNSNLIISGTIIECVSKDMVRLHFDGPLYGTACRLISNCYYTKEECENDIKRISEENIKYYCEQIKDVNDLINFALKTDISLGEYTDYDARNAYIKRAKELGFKINKE